MEDPDSSQRVLAYVQRITDIRPIPEADSIEVASVLGWKIVVKKGRYEINDLIIYAEIDSILPPWPTFVADNMEKFGFRIKTVRMRGQISQGYCIPLGALKEHPTRRFDIVASDGDPIAADAVSSHAAPCLIDIDTRELVPLVEGTDMTALIGIGKYEHADQVAASIGGGARTAYLAFPDFLRKTDQTRIQNMVWFAARYGHMEFEVTEKVDGSSITAYYRRDEFGVCSRNLRIDLAHLSPNDHNHAAVKLMEELGLHERLQRVATNVALQGELIGPRIQGNPYKLKDYRWLIFDAFLIDYKRYATPGERKELLDRLGVTHLMVPIVNDTMRIAHLTVDQVLLMADGKSKLNLSTLREGLVFKSCSLVNDHTVSFKAISNSFLLKHS